MFSCAGKGDDFYLDQYSVKQKLNSLNSGTSSDFLKYVIKEITVYVPSEILRDINLIDCPGTNDADNLHKRLTLAALNNADVIVALL